MSLGCVGLLKTWLDRAVSLALERGKQTLPIAILKETALPQYKLARLAKELDEGERYCADQYSAKMKGSLSSHNQDTYAYTT
jgi:hypothetical protein